MMKATEEAFASAFEIADCETLINSVIEWFDTPYRTPDNALDVLPCIQSAMDQSFARREDECRRAWRNVEAEAWKTARTIFDFGIRRFVEAIAHSTAGPIEQAPDPRTAGRRRGNVSRSAWGTSSQRPAIGSGWGKPPSNGERHVNAWGPPRT